MTSKPVAFLLADLGVTKTHSRPHTSNDNPYSQAQFKTLKYRPEFPDRFGSIEDARAFCQTFFPWYLRPERIRKECQGIGLCSNQMPLLEHAEERSDVWSLGDNVPTAGSLDLVVD
jgi:transposase InsO family protein